MFLNVAFNLSAHLLCCHLVAGFSTYGKITSGPLDIRVTFVHFPFENNKFEAHSKKTCEVSECDRRRLKMGKSTF